MGASNPGIQSQMHSSSLHNNMNTAASLDAFKASTSRFANTFATFAQRAASQVVGGVNGVPTTPTHEYHHDANHSFHNDPQQQSYPNNNNNNSYTPTNAATQSTSASFSTTNYASSSPGISSPGQNQSMVPVADLDNEQKAALIQTHVGDLLAGERVIMFLSNLLHVSCSRDNFQYSHSYQQQQQQQQSGGGHNNNSMWCCAMTYYRLILFRTDGPPHDGSSSGAGGTLNASPSSSHVPADWNASCWPPASNSQPSILEMPLARYVS